MHCLASFITAIVSFSFLEIVWAANTHGLDPSLRKHHVARSSGTLSRNELDSSLNVTQRGLEKRFDNAKFTLYDAGLGACGQVNSNSDFIVALNHLQFDSGGYCFKTITINYQGKSAQAQIVDRCEICPYGGLDLSRGLFSFFGSQGTGIIFGSWGLGSGAPPPPPPPSPSPKPEPKPEVTQKPTSTPKTQVESTKQPSSTSVMPSSSSSIAQSSSIASSTTPSTTPLAIPTDTFGQFDQALYNLANVVAAAATNH